MTATELRMLAHIATLAALLGVCITLVLAGRRGVNMRYRLVLVATLGVYALWFFLLSISLRDAGFVRREEIAWLFGGVEMTGAVLGWTWLALTVRASFRLVVPVKPPQNIGGPTHDDNRQEDPWLPAQAL